MQDRVARYLALVDAPDTLELIAQRVSEGETLGELCRAWDVPVGRVNTWLMADQSRYDVYKRALEIHAHAKVQETIAIADAQAEVVREDGTTFDPNVVRDRLRVDTRFRVAKYHAPALYADKMEVKHSGTVTFSHALSAIAQRRLAAKQERAVIDVTPVTVPDEAVL